MRRRSTRSTAWEQPRPRRPGRAGRQAREGRPRRPLLRDGAEATREGASGGGGADGGLRTLRLLGVLLGRSTASTTINTSFVSGTTGRTGTGIRGSVARRTGSRRTWRCIERRLLRGYSYNFCWRCGRAGPWSGGGVAASDARDGKRLSDHVWNIEEWITYPANPVSQSHPPPVAGPFRHSMISLFPSGRCSAMPHYNGCGAREEQEPMTSGVGCRSGRDSARAPDKTDTPPPCTRLREPRRCWLRSDPPACSRRGATDDPRGPGRGLPARTVALPPSGPSQRSRHPR